MPIKNTPGVEERWARPRVSTDKRGAEVPPEGYQPRVTGPTRGKYPKDNGGPPTPDFPSKSGPSGDYLTAPVPSPRTVAPIATRKSADEPTTRNPLR